MVDRSTLMGSPRGSCQRLVIFGFVILQHRRIAAASNWPMPHFATLYSRAELTKIVHCRNDWRVRHGGRQPRSVRAKSRLFNRTGKTAEAVPPNPAYVERN